MDGDVLAKNLGDLGRQLDDATVELARLDVLATAAGIKAANEKEKYEDAYAEAFRDADGSIEARKVEARLESKLVRWGSQDASAAWERAKSDVRNQQAMVRALNARIDIGRSLLSREKSLAAVLGG